MATGKRLVLVTGGLGYIGSHVAVDLLSSGRYDVIVVDNLSNSDESVLQRIRKLAPSGALHFYPIDVRDAARLEAVLGQFMDYARGRTRVEAVLHFAGLKAVGESALQPVDYYQCNVGGALAVLQAMRAFKVDRLIFSSSASVYGDGVAGQGGFREQDTADLSQIASPYGRSKRMAEQVLEDASRAYGLQVVSLRYFNPAGAHPTGLLGESPRHCLNLFPRLAHLALCKADGEPCLTVHGRDYGTPDGTCVRDYVHVVDVARGHLLALDHLCRRPDNGCYYANVNLGSERGHSVLEAVSVYTRVTGSNVPMRFGPRRPGDAPVLVADCSRARELLGWRPQLSLEDACADLFKWLHCCQHDASQL